MQLILKQNIEFYIVYGVLEAKYWSGLPFSPPVDPLLPELSIMTHSSWVALHGMPHNCTESRKPLTTTRVWSVLNFIFVFHRFHSLFFFFDLHILLKHLESLLSTITSLFLLILTYLEVWEAGFYFFIYITSKILMKSMWASSKYWNLPLQCYPCWQ